MAFAWIFGIVTVVAFAWLLLYMRVSWGLRRRYAGRSGGTREIDRRLRPYRYGSAVVGGVLAVCLALISTM